MHDLLEAIVRWSPYVWMFGSLFGVALSGALYRQARRQRLAAGGGSGVNETADFWWRHALWFLVMHISFVAVGGVSIARVDSDWASLLVVGVLLSIPLILVYRSYDSLRLHSRERRDAGD